jgi:hypothetical protein
MLVSSLRLTANPGDEIRVLHRLLCQRVHNPLGSFDLNHFLLITNSKSLHADCCCSNADCKVPVTGVFICSSEIVDCRYIQIGVPPTSVSSPRGVRLSVTSH